MTSSYVVAVECEGFLPLDPRDPENLDRKLDDRERAHNPASADASIKERDRERDRKRKEYRREVDDQRALVLDTLASITRKTTVRLADKLIRDDGTAILYFDFDPAPEGDHFIEREEVKLDEQDDPKRGPLLPARRVIVEKPNEDTEGEGAKTWDSALRNEVEQARSSVVGAGLQVVGVRVEAIDDGKKKDTKSQGKEAKVSDQEKSTHQETQGSVEPDPSDREVQEQRSEELQEQAEARRKEAERVAERQVKDRQSKDKRR